MGLLMCRRAARAPLRGYRRVEWVCEAARDVVWSFWRCFVVRRVPGADFDAEKYGTV